MKIRNTIFAVAVGGSLVAHLLLVLVMSRVKLDRPAALSARPAYEEMVVYLDEIADAPPWAPPARPPESEEPKVAPDPAAVAEPLPAEPEPAPEPEREPEDFVGEQGGTGYGINASPGEDILQAPEAENNQAYLSRDPVRMSDLVKDSIDDPASAGLLPGDGGVGGVAGPTVAPVGPRLAETPPVPPSAQALPSPPAPRVPFGVPVEIVVPRIAARPPVRATAPQAPVVEEAQPDEAGDVAVATEAPDAAPGLPRAARPAVPAVVIKPVERPGLPIPPPPALPPAAVPAGTGDSRAPGSPRVAAGDPAIETDSESDPFTVLGSVTFHNGRLDVRSGRKVRTTRPRFLLAANVDSWEGGRRTVQLKVHTDVTGKVLSVDVYKSSGSFNIDDPCRKAVYDWWFEPKKDRDGNPQPDAFLFSITIQ